MLSKLGFDSFWGHVIYVICLGEGGKCSQNFAHALYTHNIHSLLLLPFYRSFLLLQASRGFEKGLAWAVSRFGDTTFTSFA